MKLTLLFMTIGLLQVSASVYSQTTKLTLAMRDAKVVEILDAIENQSEFRFAYSPGYIDLERTLSMDVKEKTLEQCLQIIFNKTDVEYAIRDRHILLFPGAMDNRSGPVVAYSQFNTMQQRTVSGNVTDSGGQPLPGVSIVIKGTTQGTVTDANGSYSLSNIPADAILVFSFVGMRTQEVVVGSQSNINVRLEEEAIGIEEVVAVGYGTQKKANLTGSVTSVTNEKLEKRSVTKSSQALVGQMSGISARQLSGAPTNNSADILIRGKGTFSGAGNSPLILVDGIESSIDAVDPNDIERISVLKDAASAAIYGSKAANGVIIIETKKGMSGEPIFNYNAYVGKQIPTMIPKMVNSWEYALISNEAMKNMGQERRYTDEQIQKFKDGTDPDYPNFDHIDYLWSSGSGIETKHDISMRGGTQRTQYMFSAGYYDQLGIIMKNKANRYDLRLNLDTQLKDDLKFSFRLAGSNNHGKEPRGGYTNGSMLSIVAGALRNSNAIPGVKPDGYFGRNETAHPEADLNSKSFIKNESSSFYGNTLLTWDIFEDLKITGQAGYTYGISNRKDFLAKYTVTPDYGININALDNTWSDNKALTLQTMIEYNKSFKNHFLSILGGVAGQNYENRYIIGFRDEFPNNELYELSAGSSARMTSTGSASSYSLSSYFGRMNYNYNEKYLFEINFRYDGSSRFPKENRWGLFPSLSAAWRLSEENFFKDAISWIDNFKVRASWGELGNQSIGNYPYQDLIALGQNYPIGNEMSPGAAVTSISNKNITWETTVITDVGIDFSLFNTSFTIDYFIKKTHDILYNISVSNLLGASPSSTNAGIVENRGWDFDIAYNNTIGDFSYGASAIFSIVNNKVKELYGELDQDINRGLFIGYPIGSSYGYLSDGLFINEADRESYAEQPFAFLTGPGVIKYVDISGPEGKPDGKVDSAYDRTVIGTPLPITTYALNLNAGYKNFDVNILFQGEGGRKAMPNMIYFFSLDNNSNVTRDAYDNRWTVENPNPKALYPKIMIEGTDFYRANKIDYWFRDATFIRLKNMQIGYTFPEKLINKLFFDKIRVYVTGENLFTITNWYKGMDPEMNVEGPFHPLTKLYVFGINIGF